MALTVTKKVTLRGKSTIDDKVIEEYTATIDTENPENINLSSFIVDKDGYRDNRKQCHKDHGEFEDQAYAVQAEITATDSNKEEA